MEGPSIHILAEELQPLVGQKVKEAFGNASFDKTNLVNQHISEIYPFGKRLLIQLETHLLVIHFLMYGSYRVNEIRENMSPRLALILSQDQLYLYNCSIRCLEVQNIKKALPLNYDILSPEWDSKTIVKAIKKHPQKSIDDILLDQEIFPGVGNIIKNEALFLSRTLPFTKVSKLSTKKLSEIALKTRNFSHNFLQWRKQFELKKNLLIYRKAICPNCETKVVRQKTGTKKRWSFYCPVCQK